MITARLRSLALASLVIVTLSGCASQPSIVGTWTASDQSPTKVINNDGSCSGMYYHGTTPLDIGGPETCALSSSETDGHYTLTVRQPPNQASYQLTLSGETMVMSSGGATIVTLTKH
jgi:hypothetical protein